MVLPITVMLLAFSIAAQIAQPNPPQTLLQGNDQVLITWSRPAHDDVFLVTGYEVVIAGKDGEFRAELSNCDMRFLPEFSCLLPKQVLMADPFNLNLGDEVLAKITVLTDLGPSDQSQQGSGAILANQPSAPIDLKEISKTRSTVILQWTPPQEAGGLEIIDYTISLVINDVNQEIVTGIQATEYTLQDRILGQDYIFVVQARNKIGLGAYSNQVNSKFIFKPDQPTGVLSSNDGLKVRIEWKEPQSNGAPITEYRVLINGKQETKNCRTTQTSCSVELRELTSDPFNLVQAEKIEVVVIAVNSVGESESSTVGSGAVIYGNPARPEKLKVPQVIIVGKPFELAWQSPESDGGSPILDYSVFYSKDDDTEVLIQDGVNDLKYEASVGQLQATETYQFFVKARNIVGLSQSSSSVTVTVKSVPTVPTSLIKQDSPDKVIRIGWSAPQSDGGEPIIDYKIYMVSSANGQAFEVIQDEWAQNSLDVVGLTQGLTYQFQVVARNQFGYSPASKTLSVLAAWRPDQPAAPFSKLEKEKVEFTWTAPNDGGLPIIGYKIFIRLSDKSTFASELTHCDIQARAVTECQIPVTVLLQEPFLLKLGEPVVVKLIAHNIIGASDLSEESIGAILAQVPGEPTQIYEISRTKTTLELSWNQPAFTGGVEILEYYLYITREGKTEQLATVTNRSYTVTDGLTLGETYKFTVKARNSAGTSDSSEFFNVQFLYSPEPPSSVSTTNQGDIVLIEWSDPVANGSPVTAYQVFINGIEESTNCSVTVTKCQVSQLSLQSEPFNLEFGSSVQVQIVAVNAYGYSSKSALSENAIIYTKASAPINLIAGQVIVGRPFTLMWKEPIFKGGTQIIGYGLYQWQDQDYKKLVTVTELRFDTIWDAQITTQQKFVITAINVMGESAFSEELLINPINVPSAPMDLQITEASDSFIRISWSPPLNDNGSPISGYKVFYNFESEKFTELAATQESQYSLTVDQAGINYAFKVLAINIAGESQFSQIVQALAASAPMAPIGLKVVKSSDMNIEISWIQSPYDGSAPIIDYAVFVAKGQGEFYTAAEGIKDELTHSIETESGQIYTFKVQARNVIGPSVPSQPLSVLAARVPNAPTDLTELSRTKTTLELQWTAPAYTGGDQVIDYTVWITTNEIRKAVASGIKNHLFTLTGLTPGMTYNIQVQARNTIGSSENSNNLKIDFVFYPEPPLKVTSNNQGNQVLIKWLDAESNGTPITSYKVFINGIREKESCKGVQTHCQVSQETIQSAPFNLQYGENVSAEVIAVNSYGESIKSLPGTGALIFMKTSAPQNLRYNQAIVGRYFTLQWSEPDFLGGTPVVEYNVYTFDDVYQKILLQTVTVSSYQTVWDSRFKVEQKFFVTAVNVMGESEVSTELLVSAIDIPTEPLNLSLTEVSDKIINLKWMKPLSDNGAPITTYRVYYDMGMNQFQELSTTTDTFYSYTVTQSGKVYAFKVVSVNQVGESKFSNEVNALAATTPMAPYQLKVVNSSDVQITISWIEGVYDGSSPIIDYAIFVAKGSEDFQKVAGRIKDQLLFTIETESGQTYKFKVESRNIIGLSVLSEPLLVLAARVPDAPTNLEEATRTKTTLELQWVAPNYAGGDQIIDYSVYRISSDIQEEVGRNVTDFKYLVTGLIPGQRYRFEVRARNQIGLGASSSPLILDFIYYPEPPKDVKTTNQGEFVLIEWSSSVSNGSPISTYRVMINGFEQQNCYVVKTSCLVSQKGFTAAPYNLQQGESIAAKVVAQNAYGESFESQSGDGALVFTTSQAPINVRSNQAIISRPFYLIWDEPEYTGGTPILEYGVYIQVEGNYKRLATVSDKYFEKVWQPSLKSVQKFVVTAINVMGESVFSQVQVISAIDVPSEPQDLQIIMASDQIIQISWSAPANNRGSPIFGYKVFCDQGVKDFKLLTQTKLTKYSFNVTQAGRVYSFKIQAINLVGDSIFSQSIDALAAVIPTAPTELQAIYVSDKEITLQWKDGPYDGSTPIIDYTIQITKGQNQSVVIAEGIKGRLSYTTDTEPGQTYTFNVRAQNIIGQSPNSLPLEVLAARVPDAPIIGFARLTQDNLVSIQWQTVYDGGSPIIDYQVKVQETNRIYAVNITNMTISGFDPGQNYTLFVQARNIKGLSNNSLPLLIATSPTPISTVIGVHVIVILIVVIAVMTSGLIVAGVLYYRKRRQVELDSAQNKVAVTPQVLEQNQSFMPGDTSLKPLYQRSQDLEAQKNTQIRIITPHRSESFEVLTNNSNKNDEISIQHENAEEEMTKQNLCLIVQQQSQNNAEQLSNENKKLENYASKLSLNEVPTINAEVEGNFFSDRSYSQKPGVSDRFVFSLNSGRDQDGLYQTHREDQYQQSQKKDVVQHTGQNGDADRPTNQQIYRAVTDTVQSPKSRVTSANQSEQIHLASEEAIFSQAQLSEIKSVYSNESSVAQSQKVLIQHNSVISHPSQPQPKAQQSARDSFDYQPALAISEDQSAKDSVSYRLQDQFEEEKTLVTQRQKIPENQEDDKPLFTQRQLISQEIEEQIVADEKLRSIQPLEEYGLSISDLNQVNYYMHPLQVIHQSTGSMESAQLLKAPPFDDSEIQFPPNLKLQKNFTGEEALSVDSRQLETTEHNEMSASARIDQSELAQIQRNSDMMMAPKSKSKRKKHKRNKFQTIEKSGEGSSYSRPKTAFSPKAQQSQSYSKQDLRNVIRDLKYNKDKGQMSALDRKLLKKLQAVMLKSGGQVNL